jgi:hypothetical protein
MKSKIINWIAIVLVLETGLLHLMTAQSEYEEAAYMGYLFVGNFCIALLSAYGIYRRQLWGWLFGLFIAVGSIIGYAWSRTQGMPGMEVEEWFTPYGIVAMAVEGIFIALFLLRPWKMTVDEGQRFTTQRPNRYIQPVLGVLILVGRTFTSMDAGCPAVRYHVVLWST